MKNLIKQISRKMDSDLTQLMSVLGDELEKSGRQEVADKVRELGHGLGEVRWEFGKLEHLLLKEEEI